MPDTIAASEIDDPEEHPPLRGRGGLAYLLGAGARYFVVPRIALGLGLSWAQWTNVEQPAHTFGTQDVAAQSGLTATGLLLLFSINFSPGR